MNNSVLNKQTIQYIIDCFSKEDFLNYLEKNNIRDIKNKSYSEITKNACRYGVLYMIGAISKKDRKLLNHIKVAIGRCGYYWHCFLSVGDYYMDMTMSQFDDKLPPVFVVDKCNSLVYDLHATSFYTVKEWFDWEENN